MRARRPALAALRSERYGIVLLLIAAAGLLASGLFGVSEARCGRAAILGLHRTDEDEQDERRILNHVCASKLWRRAAQPCRDRLTGNDGADGEDSAPGEPPFIPLAPARVHD